MGMRNEIRTEARIDGTADEVWSVLSDFASYGEWNPGMEDVQGEAKVGSRLRIRFALNGGRTMTTAEWRHDSRVVAQHVFVDALGHAWSGGDPKYAYNDAAAPDATALLGALVRNSMNAAA